MPACLRDFHAENDFAIVACFLRLTARRGRARQRRREPFGYKRFAQAAQAIRFAVEDLPPEFLVGAFLEVDEQRYGSNDIRRLYDSAEYPLARRRG